VKTSSNGKRTFKIPFISRKDFEDFTLNYKICSITETSLEKERTTEEESREVLTTYLRGIVKILLPVETD
jgi:hypothetical protein